jgi:hypothetical protein
MIVPKRNGFDYKSSTDKQIKSKFQQSEPITTGTLTRNPKEDSMRIRLTWSGFESEVSRKVIFVHDNSKAAA